MPENADIESIINESMRLPFYGSKWLMGDEKRVNITQYYSEKQHSMIWEFIPGSDVMGPPGLCHGGLLASIMDECMGSFVFLNGHIVFTVNLQIKYRSPAPLNQIYFAISQIVRTGSKRIYAECRITDINNYLFASSSGFFIKTSWDKVQNLPVDFEKFKMLKKLLNEGTPLSEVLRKIS